MSLHESAETSAIRWGEPDEFVEIHRVHLRKIREAGAMQADERIVNGERCLPGRQTEHRCRFVAQLLDNQRGGCPAGVVDGVTNLQFHSRLGRYAGIFARPCATANASWRAPIAGSFSRRITRLCAAIDGSNTFSCSHNHGTAWNMPPARTNEKSSPSISSRFMTASAAITSSSAA